ncbi:MAG: ribbon-helix-helix protein, CopG family [Desulfobaccales bacterium]|jgi:hypothetical protein
MGRPKIFHGSNVGVKLPKDVDTRLRAAALETGRTLSDLIRETLAQTWGKGRPRPQAEAR